MIKLSERIYYMPHDEDTDRPILGYVKGDNYSLMIDSGNSKNHADLFIEEIKALDLKYPDFVAITHSHWDHTFGMNSLDAISIACKRTNEILKDMIRKEYPDLSEIKVKTADIVFDENLSIDLGQITCKLMRLESSHADDCVVAYIPEEKIVFIGDIISEDFHNGEVYYKDKLESLIKDFKGINFNTALFGHLEPFTKEELIEWLEEVKYLNQF
jgi:glyoxylase-like metal-dependent hydrolase (beta-lactamase superfamily II)